MKFFNRKLLSLLFASLMTAGGLMASPFNDVPNGHWAYDAVKYLSQRGYVQGFPDGKYKGKQAVTRYGLAVIIANFSAAMENALTTKGNFVVKKDLLTLEKLTVEFADELALIGVKIANMEEKMSGLKEDVSLLKEDVGQIQKKMKKGSGYGPVRWAGGDFGIRYHTFSSQFDNSALKDTNNGEVDAEIRFHLDIAIDEAVSGHAVVKVGNIDASNAYGNGQGTERGLSTTGEWEFQELFVTHRELFGVEGTTILGRRYISLGNKLALATEMDGIRFQRRFLDAVDVDLFWYNNRADARHQLAGINLEHDFSSNHHGYLYAFANGAENAMGVAAKNASDIADDVYAGLGLNGSFNDFWDYYVAALVTTEDKDGITGSTDDYTGVEWLVGFKYFPNKEWDFRFQAAGGNDELVDPAATQGGKLVNTDHRYYDDAVAPFEDVSRAFMGFNGAGPVEAPQLRPINSIALALEANWHYNEWHDFRLAFDHWNTSDDSVTKRATPWATYNISGAAITDYNFNLATFEYRFKSSENGRLRLGVSYLDFDNETPLAGNLGDFEQTNLYGEFSYRF